MPLQAHKKHCAYLSSFLLLLEHSVLLNSSNCLLRLPLALFLDEMSITLGNIKLSWNANVVAIHVLSSFLNGEANRAQETSQK
eukprot:2942087-Amphidinium_carterae.1